MALALASQPRPHRRVILPDLGHLRCSTAYQGGRPTRNRPRLGIGRPATLGRVLAVVIPRPPLTILLSGRKHQWRFFAGAKLGRRLGVRRQTLEGAPAGEASHLKVVREVGRPPPSGIFSVLSGTGLHRNDRLESDKEPRRCCLNRWRSCTRDGRCGPVGRQITTPLGGSTWAGILLSDDRGDRRIQLAEATSRTPGYCRMPKRAWTAGKKDRPADGTRRDGGRPTEFMDRISGEAAVGRGSANRRWTVGGGLLGGYLTLMNNTASSRRRTCGGPPPDRHRGPADQLEVQPEYRCSPPGTWWRFRTEPPRCVLVGLPSLGATATPGARPPGPLGPCR